MKKNIASILIIFFVSILAVRQMPFTTYFASHDDTSPLRQLEMHKCFLDFQIPCRWVPDMAYGYGYPLFNYYPPLPYLVGEPFMFAGFSEFASVKFSFFLSLFLSGLAVYFFAKHIFNNVAGLLSAVFYVWAPYRALDIYVRGALNESWSFVFIPLILLFSLKLITEANKSHHLPLLAFSLAGLFLSHNLIVLIFLPFYALWIGSILLISKSTKKIIPVALGSVLGLGIASYFTIPAFFEKNLVWLDFINEYFDFRKHFVYLNQLFINRDWGYGMSFEGPGDGMSFQIGHLLWIFAVLALVLFVGKQLHSYLKQRKFNWKTADSVGIVVFILAILSLSMTTIFSQPVWDLASVLSIVQFPWRFLTLSTLFFSVSAGYLIFNLRTKLAWIVSIIGIILIVVLNWNYFLPDKTNPYRSDSTAGYTLKDFLPKTSPDGPPGSKGNDLIASQAGNAFYTDREKSGTNWFSFEIKTNETFTLTINALQFPNWKVYVDNKESLDQTDDTGRIIVSVAPGTHNVFGHLDNTWIRTISNIVSLMSITISFLILSHSIFYQKTRI